jgi:hypothetical protein
MGAGRIPQLIVKTLLILTLLTSGALGYGDPCATNADCDPKWEYCDNRPEADGGTFECEHKHMFPMLAEEFVGSFFCIFIVMLANAGGLGGGGVAIPVGIAFYKFDTREAIAMSNASVFISSLVRFFLILKRKHPLKPYGLVVDYDIATLMLPSIIVGANLGVIANLIVPETIIIVGFTVILFGLFIRSMLKTIDLYR